MKLALDTCLLRSTAARRFWTIATALTGDRVAILPTVRAQAARQIALSATEEMRQHLLVRPAPDKRTGTQAMIAAENAAHEWWAAETRSNDPAFGFVDPMRSHAEEYRAWRLLLPRYCHKGSNAAPDDLEIIAEALAQKIPILATNNFTSIRIGWTNAHVRKQGWRTSDLIRLPEDALSTLERTASIPDLGLKALLAAAVSTAERPAEADISSAMTLADHLASTGLASSAAEWQDDMSRSHTQWGMLAEEARKNAALPDVEKARNAQKRKIETTRRAVRSTGYDPWS